MSETQTQTTTGVALIDTNHQFLRDAGASEALLELIKFDAREIGIKRHSAKREVEKYASWGALEGDTDDFDHLGGHFFTAMWDGDLFGAWLRADMNNRAILMEVFGENRILESGLRSDRPAAYVKRMVSETVA